MGKGTHLYTMFTFLTVYTIAQAYFCSVFMVCVCGVVFAYMQAVGCSVSKSFLLVG